MLTRLLSWLTFRQQKNKAIKVLEQIIEQRDRASSPDHQRKLCDPAFYERQAIALRWITQTREQPSSSAFIELATALHHSGQDPIPTIREAVARFPNDFKVLALASRLLCEYNADPQETISTINSAVKLDPRTNRYVLDLALAITMARAGDIEGARELFRTGIAERTKSPNDIITLPWQHQFAKAYHLHTDVATEILLDGRSKF